MKRLMALISLFSLLVFSPIMASVTDLSNTYSYTNETAAQVTVYVSTTTIIPGVHKILGFNLVPTSNSTQGTFAALYDATSTTVSTEGLNLSNMLGENESVANYSKDKFFPWPKPLSKGLTIVVGAYTTISVDFSR